MVIELILFEKKERFINLKTFTDDPYYCGLRARVPNFVSKSKAKEPVPYKRYSISQQQHPQPPPLMHQHHMHQNPMWHARSYESGIGT